MSDLEIASERIRGGACAATATFLTVWAMSAVGAPRVASAVDPDVAAKTQVETSGFVYREVQVDTKSARAGDGQKVYLGTLAVGLHGREIRVGEVLRAATLQDPTLQEVAIAEKKGQVRILSIVPSLETPICEQQTHYLSEKSAGLSDRVELVSISLDAPEVQGKFAREAEIENVTFLSDAAAEAFGRAHGLLIEQPHILARAVIVVDARNIVRYLQVVPDVSHMPDLEAAFAFARELIAVGGS